MLLVSQQIAQLNKYMTQFANPLRKKQKNLRKEVEHSIAQNKGLSLFKKIINRRKLTQFNSDQNANALNVLIKQINKSHSK